MPCGKQAGIHCTKLISRDLKASTKGKWACDAMIDGNVTMVGMLGDRYDAQPLQRSPRKHCVKHARPFQHRTAKGAAARGTCECCVNATRSVEMTTCYDHEP